MRDVWSIGPRGVYTREKTKVESWIDLKRLIWSKRIGIWSPTGTVYSNGQEVQVNNLRYGYGLTAFHQFFEQMSNFSYTRKRVSGAAVGLQLSGKTRGPDDIVMGLLIGLHAIRVLELKAHNTPLALGSAWGGAPRGERDYDVDTFLDSVTHRQHDNNPAPQSQESLAHGGGMFDDTVF